MEVQTCSGITRHIDIRPAIIVEVRDQRSEAVIILGGGDMHESRDIVEVTVPVILIEGDGFSRQTSRPADHRQPFPFALRPFSRMRSSGGVKLNVVGNNKVKKTIPIEVQKRAS